VRLDDGFEYYVVEPHPSLSNQPMVWQKPAFEVGIDAVGGNVAPLFSRPGPRSQRPSPRTPMLEP
jgi:hypothetical protein